MESRETKGVLIVRPFAVYGDSTVLRSVRIGWGGNGASEIAKVRFDQHARRQDVRRLGDALEESVIMGE